MFFKNSICENFDFVFNFLNKKNVQYVLGHYIVHGHTKFQADIFGSHFTALKRCWPDRSMVPTYSDLAFGITKSSTSVFALASLSCEWILILNKVLVRYLFKYIWYLSIQTIDIIYGVEQKNWPFMIWPRQHNPCAYPWSVKYRLETSCNEFLFQKLHKNMYHTTNS